MNIFKGEQENNETTTEQEQEQGSSEESTTTTAKSSKKLASATSSGGSFDNIDVAEIPEFKPSAALLQSTGISLVSFFWGVAPP